MRKNTRPVKNLSYLCRCAEETAHVYGNIWLPAGFLIGSQQNLFRSLWTLNLCTKFHMCWSNVVWSLLLWKCVGALQVSSVAHKLAQTGFGGVLDLKLRLKVGAAEILCRLYHYNTKFKYTCVWVRSLFKHANSEADWKIFNNLCNLELLPSAKHHQSLNYFVWGECAWQTCRRLLQWEPWHFLWTTEYP